MEKSVDYLIIGQGLAGTCLAYKLLALGKTVILVDECKSTTSSRVAAGLYNPVVFKRLSNSWKANELIPAMQAFYKHAEELTGKVFLHNKYMLKLFANTEERLFWQKKQQEGNTYLSADVRLFKNKGFTKEQECAYVNHSGYLDTIAFLDSSRTYFTSQRAFVHDQFQYTDLVVEASYVQWKKYKATKVVFCEGLRASQ